MDLTRLKKEMKTVAVDGTVATYLYTPIMIALEHYVLGMNPEEIRQTREFGAVLNYVSTPMYNGFRSYWANLFGTTPDSSERRKTITDTSSQIVFSITLYLGNIGYNGADTERMAIAIPMILGLSVLTGRAFASLNDFMRDKAGCKAVLRKQNLETVVESVVTNQE